MNPRTHRSGWLFAAPALALLFFAVILPFCVAVGMTMTNQRLLSPNQLDFVGGKNYQRLLSLGFAHIPAKLDEQGNALLDSRGDPVYQSIRELKPSPPEEASFQILRTFQWRGERYAILAKDPVFWRALFNTLYFVVLVLPIQLGTALGLALLVNANLPGRTALRTLFFSPVVTSMVVAAIVWTFLYNENAGLINKMLGLITGQDNLAINWLGNELLAMPSIVIMSTWQGAGFQMLIFLAGLQSINRELYEAARLDGANAIQRFFNVTLPGLKNTLVFVLISTTIAAFSLFIQVDIMTNGGPNDSTATLIFHAIRTGYREQDVAYGASIAVVYFILVLGVALLQNKLGGRRG